MIDVVCKEAIYCAVSEYSTDPYSTKIFQPAITARYLILGFPLQVDSGADNDRT